MAGGGPPSPSLDSGGNSRGQCSISGGNAAARNDDPHRYMIFLTGHARPQGLNVETLNVDPSKSKILVRVEILDHPNRALARAK